MFKVHRPEDIRDVIGAKAVLVAPVPAELAPPVEETESVFLDTPWLIGWGLLFVSAFATIGFLLYA